MNKNTVLTFERVNVKHQQDKCWTITMRKEIKNIA